jgi:inorganic triphosphatase YgiF
MAEVELKFELPREAHGAFRRQPALKGVRSRREPLTALYFDTPEGELAANGMALRLRRSGRRWKQTLKAGRSGAGGLHARDEWEFARPGPELDLALFKDTPLAALPDAATLHERLMEVFRVEVERTTWQVRLGPGVRVEVALDVGEVRHGRGSEPVSEVEIESIEGEPLAVFDFADRVIDAVPMRPSAVTKAHRGYRLLRGQALSPAAAGPPALDAGMTAVQAAGATLGAALEQLQANEEGAMASDDPEFVHQMRVALRRMRTTLRAYRKALEPAFEAQVREELRWITQEAGHARDLDVLAMQTLPGIVAAREHGAPADFAARLESARNAARQRLREALQSPRYARLMLAFARERVEAEGRAPAIDVALADFAARAIRKRHRRLIQSAQGIDHMEPTQRHGVRIAAKRLRYVAEGFAALFSARKVGAYVKALSSLQEALGRANDAAVATRLLGDLEAPEPFASFAQGWLAGQTHASNARLARRVARVESAKPFWRKA